MSSRRKRNLACRPISLPACSDPSLPVTPTSSAGRRLLPPTPGLEPDRIFSPLRKVGHGGLSLSPNAVALGPFMRPPNSIVVDMRGSRRGISPSRLRSVTSMTQLLPLHLASSSVPSPTSQLRRTHSDPTVRKQLHSPILAEDEARDSNSVPASAVIASAHTNGEMSSHQALFDIDIFQPGTDGLPKTPEITLLSTDDEGVIGGSSPLGIRVKDRPDSRSDGRDEEEDRCGGHLGVTVGRLGQSSTRHRHETSPASFASRQEGPDITTAVGEGLSTVACRVELQKIRRSSIPNLNFVSWLADSSDDETSSVDSALDPTRDRASPEARRLNGIKSIHTSRIEYATAVAPSKAMLVEVSSKRSSTCSVDAQTSSARSTNITEPEDPHSPSFTVPVTPPSSPRRSFLDVDGDGTSIRPPPPSSSPTSALGGKVRIVGSDGKVMMTIPPHSPPEPGDARQRRRCAKDMTGLSDILAVIGQAVAGFPALILQLDSQVITSIRAYTSTPASSNTPAVTNTTTTTTTTTTMQYRPRLNDHTTSKRAINDSSASINVFRDILHTRSDVLPTVIYNYVIVMNFFDDLLLLAHHDNHHHHHFSQQQQHQGGSQGQHCSSDVLSSLVSPDDDLIQKAKHLRQDLGACLRRLVDGIAGCDSGNEVLCQALMTVARLTG